MDIKIEKVGRRDMDNKDVFKVVTYRSAVDINGVDVKVPDQELYIPEDYFLQEKAQLEARLSEINEKITKLSEVKNAIVQEGR